MNIRTLLYAFVEVTHAGAAAGTAAAMEEPTIMAKKMLKYLVKSIVIGKTCLVGW